MSSHEKTMRTEIFRELMQIREGMLALIESHNRDAVNKQKGVVYGYSDQVDERNTSFEISFGPNPDQSVQTYPNRVMVRVLDSGISLHCNENGNQFTTGINFTPDVDSVRDKLIAFAARQLPQEASEVKRSLSALKNNHKETHDLFSMRIPRRSKPVNGPLFHDSVYPEESWDEFYLSRQVIADLDKLAKRAGFFFDNTQDGGGITVCCKPTDTQDVETVDGKPPKLRIRFAREGARVFDNTDLTMTNPHGRIMKGPAELREAIENFGQRFSTFLTTYAQQDALEAVSARRREVEEFTVSGADTYQYGAPPILVWDVFNAEIAPRLTELKRQGIPGEGPRFDYTTATDKEGITIRCGYYDKLEEGRVANKGIVPRPEMMMRITEDRITIVDMSSAQTDQARTTSLPLHDTVMARSELTLFASACHNAEMGKTTPRLPVVRTEYLRRAIG